MTREQVCQEAKNLFTSGYNCAQAVLGAVAPLCGMDLDTALRISAPFGGGIGRTRDICGAVSGSIMALGLVSSAAPTDKAAVYADTQALLARYKEENGSYICRELLAGVKVTEGAAPEERTEKYYKKRPCTELVCQAAGFAYDILVNDILVERGKV